MSISFNRKNYSVTLREDEYLDYWTDKLGKPDENEEYIRWYMSKKNFDAFLKKYEDYEMVEEVDEEEEDEDEKKDIPIQRVLQHRITSERIKSKEITPEIDIDSDDEDIVSISRRLRYIYRELKKLQ